MKAKALPAVLFLAASGFGFWRWKVSPRRTDPPLSINEAATGVSPAPTTATAIASGPEAAGPDGSSEADCEKAKAKIRFASPDVARWAGIGTAEACMRPLSEKVEANGRVVLDAARTAHLASRIPGVIREFRKDLGQDVEAGETLVVIDSMELGEAESEYLRALAAEELARRSLERERSLAARGATSERELLAAEAEGAAAGAALSRAGDRLMNLGVADGEVERLRKERKVSSRLALAAPFAGTLVERDGTPGELTDPAKTVLTLTDLSRVWVLLDLFEKDIARIEVGQKALFTADACPDRHFRGRLTWISSIVDPESRTLVARMEVPNARRLLKANLFGKAAITVREEVEALTVPKEAVQWEGCHHVVFVPLQEGWYQTRQVRLGYAGNDFYELTEGLLPGERVVTAGSFLLKTEILKGAIGAG